MALGVAIGTLPLYGLHLALAVLAAVVFRLNKATVALASAWSIPVVAPFLVAGGLAIGEALRFGRIRALSTDEAAIALVGDRFVSCLLGDAVLGLALGTLAGLATWRWAARRARRPRTDRGEPEEGEEGQ